MNIKDLIKSKPRIAVLTLSAAVVLIIAAVLLVSGVFSKKSVVVNSPGSSAIPEALHDVKITGIEPIDCDTTGVSLKSEFRLLCNKECNEEEFKTVLDVSPKQDYTIKKVSGKEYRVSFQGGLKANSIYKFATKNVEDKKSWAFQTKKTFKVVRTLPGDKATSVPLNSGIEITFSHENFKNIDDYFEIQPKVKGRFEYHKKVAVFVPERLEEDTVYTVTVKKGLELREGNEKTEKDHTFKFQTGKNPHDSGKTAFFAFSNYLYNFTTKAMPVLDVNTDGSYNGASVKIEVLKYQKEDDFEKNVREYAQIPLWAYRDCSKLKVDIKSLQKVASFTSIVRQVQEYWYGSYIEFPEALKEGHYLIKLTVAGISYYTNVQVSDASTYISIGKDRTLVWVNDAVTGNPVSGASVEGYGSSAKIGDDGVAVLNAKIPVTENTNSYYFKILRNNRPSLYAVVSSDNYRFVNNAGEITSDIYWSYLYLDRGMYLPQDVVKLWGMIKPRENKEIPDSAEVQLYKYEYSYFETNELPALESKKIKLSDNGTFKDEMALDNLEPGNYSIRIKLDNKVICEKGFDVKEYVKPAYKLDIKPDKYALFAGEKANFNMQASFFEGSPVPGMKLKYYYYLGSSNEGTVNCGNDGAGRLSIDTDTGEKSWQPVYINMHVTNSEAEEQEIYSDSLISVFPKDTMFEVETVKEGKKGVVEIKTSLIDLSKIESGDSGYFITDDYRGTPVNKSLTAKVYEKHWDKKVVGDYYDFINKRTEKRYEYYEVNNLIKEVKLSTVDGKGGFEFPLLDGSDWYRCYYVEVSGYDSKNNEVVETSYMYSKYYHDYNSQFKSYNIFEESGKDSFKQGEKVKLGIQYGGEELKPGPKAKTLFLTQKNGLLGYKVSSDSKHSFDMDSNFIPNVNITAVHFDGTNTIIAGSKDIRYDYTEKELKINIKPDKNEYKPGDTANIEVEVRDKNGDPCAAEVNLSVVDEAFFAMQNQSVDILYSLYCTSVSSGELASYVSYTPLNMNRFGGAECGEGGDSGVRAIFKDNAFFDTVTTGKDGKAKASFKLPDNLTSWRITYQALTDDLKAGSGKTNIAVKLPFFVDVMFNSIFMENDSPCLTVRTYGTELKSGDTSDYEVLLENTGGMKKTFNASGKANLFTAVPLGSLTLGDYSVTVKAKSGTHSDAVKRSFKVVENILEAGKNKSYMLSDTLKIEGGKTLTSLEFFNKDASLYYQTLNSLIYTWGDRVDQKLCRKLATDLMKKYFNEEDYWNEEFDFRGYQKEDGGIALLKHGSSEPLVSAQISSLAKDEFDKLRLRLYFYGILDNKDSVVEDVVWAYLGLASLNEPVLNDIKSLLKSTDSKLEAEQKITLIQALAELGDYNEADARYNEIIQNNLVNIGSMSYFNVKGNKDAIIKATAICSVIACKLNKPEKTQLVNYITENQGKDLITNYEQMVFVSNSIPDVKNTGKFTYELNGKKTEVALKNAERYRLLLTAESLNKIRFYDVKGDIAVLSSFKGPLKEFMQAKNNIVSLKRTYFTGSKTSNNFKQSDLITVRLYPEFSKTAPDGYYEITDVLPCGLKYVEGRPYVETRSYPDAVNGQKVVFGVYYTRNSSEKPKNIEYFARAVSPGEFTADNAVIKHSMSDAAGFTDKTKIIINK